MTMTLIKAFFVLPVPVLVLIPAIILYFTPFEITEPLEAAFWLALGFAAIGLFLILWTTKLFITKGEGTPAPWQPPHKFVVAGPSRHTRNPMILGAVFLLAAEALLFKSLGILVWMIIFFLGKTLYFVLVEEKELERRFSDSYLKYKANVPRWRPRLTPWSPEGE